MFRRASFMLKLYDMVVIGGGSGGLEAAYNSAEMYKKHVLVIDTQKVHGPPMYSALGGTCVNVGCVPKKLMVTGARYREHLKDAKGFGWNIPSNVIGDWNTMITAKNKAVLDINKSYEEMFNGRLEFAEGFGRLKSANEVEVMDRDQKNVLKTVQAKNILIATGSWPFHPFPEEHCISSNEAFYLTSAPKHPLIVGGGYIAVEFAGIFNGYLPAGGKVTLCYRSELFLRKFDFKVREALAEQMRSSGIDLWFNENPKSIEKLPNGNKKVTFESGKVSEHDVVMIATGRKAKTAGLNLEGVGVTLKPSGGIIVDKGNRTNIPSVYAIGDVTDGIQLTPVAIHEGACLAATLFNNENRYPDYINVASAVFSDPPIGTVGMIEEDAVKVCKHVAVYESSFTPLMHKVSGQLHKKFLVRVITDHDTDKILGVHILGADAPEIIQMVGVAVKMGAKMRDLYSTIGVHPTSAEELCSMRTPSYTIKNGVKVTQPSL